MSPILNHKPAVSKIRPTRIARARILVAIAVVVLLIILLTFTIVEAGSNFSLRNQGQFHWSTPKQIPNHYDLLRAPILVADRQHTVHAFDMRAESAQDFTILYRQWDLQQGWSNPLGILIPEFGGSAPSLMSVYLDDSGFFHLIYFGGDFSGGNLYYSAAHMSEADNARSWSDPIPLTSYAAQDTPAGLIGLDDGELIVIFSGERYGLGLYEVHSTDGGCSWSDSALLSRSKEQDQPPASIWLAIDNKSRLHVVWHTANALGQGGEIRYANIDADLITLQNETVIAFQDTELDSLGWPSIISSQDDLILVYEDGFPPSRWVVYSNDSGKTWSTPIRPFPHRGGYGVAYLLKDSAGAVHLVLGNRLQNPEIYGMWYSRLVGEHWLPLSPIISGPSEDSFGPCCPQAVISQGNVLLATWPHNVPREFLTGAWYSYIELASPELPTFEPSGLTEFPDQSELPVRTIIAPQPTITPVTQLISNQQQNSRRGSASFTNPLFIGLVPILLGIGLVIMIRRLSYRDDSME